MSQIDLQQNYTPEELMSIDAPLEQKLEAIRQTAGRHFDAQATQTMVGMIDELITREAVKQTLKVGQSAPNFTIPDHLERPVELAKLLQEGPVVLTFYRGAWCPYCNLALHAYQQALPAMRELGAHFVAISPQTPDHSLTQVEKQQLTFPVLSDSEAQVARQFGLVFTVPEQAQVLHQALGANIPGYNGNPSWELPMPANFLIDQQGIIRFAHVDPNFTQRLDPETILNEIKALHA